MPRVKRGTKRRAKRKKILDRASGYFLTKSKLYRSAKEAVERGLKFAYAGRRQKKRQYRSLWIVRIGVAYQIAAAQLALALLVLRGQDVAQKRMPAFHFPGCSFLKALRGALVSL